MKALVNSTYRKDYMTTQLRSYVQTHSKHHNQWGRVGPISLGSERRQKALCRCLYTALYRSPSQSNCTREGKALQTRREEVQLPTS